MNLTIWWRDFISVFYPNLCIACANNLPMKKDFFCVKCQFQLPKTDFHLLDDNPMNIHFWGRVPIQYAAALYYFTKDSKVQYLIHQLKYSNKQHIGLSLGNYYAKQLVDSKFNEIDCIVPVPLHKKKEYIRGYNQSALFAQGLSNGLQKPWYSDVLQRNEFTHTQTKKNRIERFENVEDAFVLHYAKSIEKKHILLVDDVITTGATLESCAKCLLKVGAKVSIATIAFANRF